MPGFHFLYNLETLSAKYIVQFYAIPVFMQASLCRGHAELCFAD